MVGWRRAAVAAAVGIAASACARANPAFDADAADTETAATGGGGSGTPATLTSPDDDGKPPPGADGTGDGTQGAPTSDDGTEPATSDDDGLPTDVGDTGVPACEFAPAFLPFTVDLTDANGNTMDPPCGSVLELVGPVQGFLVDEITLVDCGACDSCPESPTTVSLHGAELGSLPSWLTPVCARVDIAMGPEADGCLPEVLLVSDAFGAQGPPEIIVTNRRDPPLLPALMPPVPALIEPRCELPCLADLVPGEYGLDFDNGETITPGVTASGITIASAAGDVDGQYDVRLRHGAIDDACTEHFGWSAVRTQG